MHFHPGDNVIVIVRYIRYGMKFKVPLRNVGERGCPSMAEDRRTGDLVHGQWGYLTDFSGRAYSEGFKLVRWWTMSPPFWGDQRAVVPIRRSYLSYQRW